MEHRPGVEISVSLGSQSIIRKIRVGKKIQDKGKRVKSRQDKILIPVLAKR